MDDLCFRVRDLNMAGWTFQSIANAFDPPRRRSTIRSWAVRGEKVMVNPRYITYTDSIVLEPVPAPPAKRPRAKNRPKSPGLSHDEQLTIARLAPDARRYRSRTLESSTASIANARLTQISGDLYQKGVTVSELARAAGVTYRAMKRRVDRALEV